MSGGGEDGPLVVLQHLSPMGNVGRMIVTRFRRQVEVGAKERCAKFRNELFHGTTLIAKPLAAKVSSKTLLVPRPVGALMGKRRIIAFPVAKSLERRHLHEIAAHVVVSAATAMLDESGVGLQEGNAPFGLSACIIGFRLGETVGRDNKAAVRS